MAVEDEKTAQPGSDPGAGQTPDSLAGKDGATTAIPDADDVLLDEHGKPLPFNTDPRFRDAMKAQRVLKTLLKDNELDDPEDLRDLIQSGKAVMGRGVDEETLEALIEKATKMDQVEAYWAQQRDAQRLSEETSEETAQRLANENRLLKQRLSGKEEVDSSRQALDTFEKKTQAFIEDSVKDMTKEERDDIKFFMGVEHPFGEIDITRDADIKKMGKQVLKTVERIEQRAIKKYLDGKLKIPKIGSSATTAVPAAGVIKTLKDARKATMESIRAKLNI